MIGNRVCVIALTAASAMTGSAAPAIAQQFDGNWGIAAQTTRGHCESIQLGLVIRAGQIFSTGGSYGGYGAGVSGRVSPSGRVQVYAEAGPRSAQGVGRLGQYQGSGTWAGRGPSGVCSGIWNAYRSRPGLGLAAGAALGTAAPYYGGSGYYGDSGYGAYASAPYYGGGGYYGNSGYGAYASVPYDTSSGDIYILDGNYMSESDAVAYCAQRFRSYDIESRTFLAYNGERLSCPQ